MNKLRLPPSDAAFFIAESPTNPQVVALVTLLDRSPSLAALQDAARRGLTYFPRMGYLTQPGSPGTLMPTAHVDINQHVREQIVSDIDDETQREAAIAAAHSRPLPADRPLWEFVLFTDGTRGAVVLWRVHHALADGIRLLDIFRAMLQPQWTTPTPVTIAPASFSLPNALSRMAATFRIIKISGKMKPIPCGFTGVSSPQRALHPIEFDRTGLRLLMRQHNTSMHAIILALVSGALAKFLRQQGHPVQDLRAIVPSNSRPVARAGAQGNSIDLLWLTLPLAEPIASARVERCAAALAQARAEGWIEFSQVFPKIAAKLPISTQRQAFDKAAKLTNIVCTIMPANLDRLELAGESIRRSYAAATLLNGHGLALTFITARNAVRGTLITDPAIVPKPHLLVTLLQRALQDFATQA